MDWCGRLWALVESKAGSGGEAVADATAVIDLQPDDSDILAQAHVNRSAALVELGRVEEAVADLSSTNSTSAAKSTIRRITQITRSAPYRPPAQIAPIGTSSATCRTPR